MGIEVGNSRKFGAVQLEVKNAGQSKVEQHKVLGRVAQFVENIENKQSRNFVGDRLDPQPKAISGKKVGQIDLSLYEDVFGRSQRRFDRALPGPVQSDGDINVAEDLKAKPDPLEQASIVQPQQGAEAPADLGPEAPKANRDAEGQKISGVSHASEGNEAMKSGADNVGNTSILHPQKLKLHPQKLKAKPNLTPHL